MNVGVEFSTKLTYQLLFGEEPNITLALNPIWLPVTEDPDKNELTGDVEADSH